ncbi:hypothetical protein [Acinetobacter phage P577]|nr:hypothetical protein [Acinetobacter phage P577]
MSIKQHVGGFLFTFGLVVALGLFYSAVAEGNNLKDTLLSVLFGLALVWAIVKAFKKEIMRGC